MGRLPVGPVDTVKGLSPPAEVCVGGRVVASDDGSLVIADATGSVQVHTEDGAALGTWVRVEGVWDGRRIRGRVEVHNRPAGAFPDPHGEWQWLQDDDRRRARLLEGRAAVVKAVRAFFDERRFLEVETPAMVPSPGLDVHLDAFEVGAPGAPRWLSTSPEYQMKRLLAGGMPRMFQLCKCFRQGELGARHEPEFTMLEWYRSFAGSREVMEDTEQLVASVARAIHDGSTRVRVGETTVDVSPPWERWTVEEAFQRYAGVRLWDVLPDEDRFFRLLVEHVEPQLGHDRPAFLVRWPASMASLARLDPEDERVADRFEAYVAGLELCNGFGELIDPAEQRRRLERDRATRRELGKPVYPIDERFLAALEEGLPPCGGNALGLDRLVMLVLGVDEMGDVVAVPQHRL